MSRDGGRTEVVTLVLTGIAVNAMTSAALAFLMFLGDTQAREEIVFWTLGSLNGSRWEYVGGRRSRWPSSASPPRWSCAPKLDLLALGDRAARHVGVDVERLRLTTIVVVAVLTAAAVAFCGIISFVGLVVPHLIRMVAGPGHRLLVPGQRARRRGAARARRPVGAHPGRVRRPADRHADRAGRRPVLLLADPPRPLVPPGAGHERRHAAPAASASPSTATRSSSASTSTSAPASWSPWSARTAPASPPCSACWPATSSPTAGTVDARRTATSAPTPPASWPGTARVQLQKQGLAFGFRVARGGPDGPLAVAPHRARGRRRPRRRRVDGARRRRRASRTGSSRRCPAASRPARRSPGCWPRRRRC